MGKGHRKGEDNRGCLGSHPRYLGSLAGKSKQSPESKSKAEHCISNKETRSWYR